MAYGLEIKGPTGTVLFDTTKLGLMLVDSWRVGAGATLAVDYPQWAGKEIIPISVSDEASGGHVTTVSGTTVTATGITLPAAFINRTSASTIHVFVR